MSNRSLLESLKSAAKGGSVRRKGKALLSRVVGNTVDQLEQRRLLRFARHGRDAVVQLRQQRDR